MGHVQRCFKEMCDFMVNGVARPIIERVMEYGPIGKCGRHIVVVAPELIPVPAEPKEAAANAARPAAKKAPAYNRGSGPPPTPEELAKGRAAADASKHRPALMTREEIEEQARIGKDVRRWIAAGSPGEFDAWQAANPAREPRVEIIGSQFVAVDRDIVPKPRK